jgi:crotonobetainyl-CoA:carnitine CoA-transferase CaiB-like acyl-CoA transferase
VTESYFDWTARLFDRAAAPAKPEALRGIRVLDLSVIVFGPATADFLGELGAEVIRVELPGTGDVMRIVAPEGYFWKNVSPAFFTVNHNKYHVGIDLHRPEGQALVRGLAARSDVLVENYRPGTLERKWGLGYRQLREINPRLIYVANTGFGQWGPHAETGRASYDALAQALSGLTAISGFPGRPPWKAGIYIGDLFGACLAAMAALAALHHRDRTGQGQFVEVAQCEALIRALDWTWVYHGLTGRAREPVGNRDVAVSPAGIFRCRDGFVAVAAGEEAQFTGLCRAMGEPGLAEDERFRTHAARLAPAHAAALHARLAAWARPRARGEIEALARAHGFAAGAVTSAADQYRDPHLRARGAAWALDDPLYGELVDYGPAPKLSATPGRLKWVGPPVGFHNAFVLGKVLGLTEAEIRALEAQRVIGQWADRVGAKPPDGWRGEGQLR